MSRQSRTRRDEVAQRCDDRARAKRDATRNISDGKAVHIHHVFDENPDLSVLSDLPEGWAAERPSGDGKWQRFPQPDDWK